MCWSVADDGCATHNCKPDATVANSQSAGFPSANSVEAIQNLKAGVPFYGAPPPLDQVPNINAAVLGVYSADPNDFANNNRDGLDAALSQAGITHQMNVYPGTKHDFYNDTGQAYNEAQALAAWNDAVNWIQMYV